MKLQCQLTPEDYVQAQHVHLRPHPLVKWMLILLAVVVLFVAVIGILLPVKDGSYASPIIIFGLLAYLFYKYRVWLPARARKIFKQQKNMHLLYDMDISDEGIHSSSAQGTVSLPWTDVHKYKVGKDLVLVYQSDLMFHIFPKRWFKEGEFEEFKALLKTRVRKVK